jgi:hypothetical protein
MHHAPVPKTTERLSPARALTEERLKAAGYCFDFLARHEGDHARLVSRIPDGRAATEALLMEGYEAIVARIGGAASGAEIGAQIVIQGFLADAVAMFLYTYVVRQLGPQLASLFLPCTPIATTLTAMAVLGEVPTSLQLGAIVIMTAGMIYPALRNARAGAAG